MLTTVQARRLVAELAGAAGRSDVQAWSTGLRRLGECDGRAWLLLDQAARAYVEPGCASVAGAKGWLGGDVVEPTGFVAAVTSFHVDGRVRQRATRVLAGIPGRVPAAALTVRLLDHAEQVREEAAGALLGRLQLDDAALILGVLLAGRARHHAPGAMNQVVGGLEHSVPVADLVETLLRDGDREVRRWALALAHEKDLLPAKRLLEVVRSDSDQWNRTVAAGWLLPVADAEQLSALLTSTTVEARLVALTRLPDEALVDADLFRLLVDRAPRVREQARRRAQRRGVDLAHWFRGYIATSPVLGYERAASLDALAAVGGPGDLPVFVTHLGHDSPRARAAALAGVLAHAPRGNALTLAAPLLLDPSPRVAAAAARALVRLGAPTDVTATAWTSSQPWSRRAAWRTDRGRGGWDRVEADLHAAAHADPDLATQGIAGVKSWVRTGAATTWAVLPDEQRRRIERGLQAGVLDRRTSETLAFYAGVTVQRRPVQTGAPAQPAAASARASRWLRVLRRSDET